MQLDKCMNMDSKKQLYIISGCNGAGKTTASYTVLPDVLECKEFVNADEIARGLSPFNPESMAIEAGRLMLQRINELLRNQQNFSIETCLITPNHNLFGNVVPTITYTLGYTLNSQVGRTQPEIY